LKVSCAHKQCNALRVIPPNLIIVKRRAPRAINRLTCHRKHAAKVQRHKHALKTENSSSSKFLFHAIANVAQGLMHLVNRQHCVDYARLQKCAKLILSNQFKYIQGAKGKYAGWGCILCNYTPPSPTLTHISWLTMALAFKLSFPATSFMYFAKLDKYNMHYVYAFCC
jgi:hypothetical protein